MKRISVIIVTLFLAHMTYAQHYLGVGAALSSPFQLDQLDETKPLFGWGESLSLQYQYRYRHFLLSIGATISGEHPRVGIENETYQPEMIDTRGIEFQYLGSLISRRDLSSNVWFHTPVMIGFETYPFYMMVGAQYSLFITSWTHQKALMAAGADYHGRYYDDYIDDMFTHGYHDYEPVSNKGRMQYKNDVRLLVELGSTLSIGYGKNGLDQLLRIGAFAEVGLMDVLGEPATQNKTEWYPKEEDYMNVAMNHIYSSADASTSSLRNMVVGVKVTCLFPAGGKQEKYKNNKYNRHSKKYKCHCLGLPRAYFLN